MENVEELHEQAKAVRERLKRDIFELREILKKAAHRTGETELEAEDQAIKAERRVEETISDIEKRFEKALGTVTCSASNNRVVTRKLNFADFTNIEIDCAFNVEIMQSAYYQVTVKTGEALIDYLDIVKSGNTLKMTLKPHRFDIRPTLEARIALPSLSKLRLGATTRGIVQGFRSTDALHIRLTGSSILETDITAGATVCEISGASRLTGNMCISDAEFTLSGASRANLTGSANNIILNAWGASEAELENFKVNDMAVHLNGASEAVINASGKLDIDLNSGSHLTYADSPTIHKISVTGASSLNHK